MLFLIMDREPYGRMSSLDVGYLVEREKLFHEKKDIVCLNSFLVFYQYRFFMIQVGKKNPPNIGY